MIQATLPRYASDQNPKTAARPEPRTRLSCTPGLCAAGASYSRWTTSLRRQLKNHAPSTRLRICHQRRCHPLPAPRGPQGHG